MIRLSLIFCMLLNLPAPLLAGQQSLKETLAEADIGFRLGTDIRTLTDEDMAARITTNADESIELNLAFLTIRDLSLIRELPLTGLGLSYSDVEDLAPLADLPLQWLELAETKVTDLSPLTNMPLTKLNLCSANVSSLSPLKGMPIEILDIDDNHLISDISALHGMPLMHLKMQDIPVADLSPLKDSPIKSLVMNGTKVKNLAPILGLPLENLMFTEDNITNGLAGLRSMKSLKTINGVSADEFWEMRELDRRDLSSIVVPPDTELAGTIQKQIDAMRKLPNAQDWPTCIEDALSLWSSSPGHDATASNRVVAIAVADYLGMKIEIGDFIEGQRGSKGAISVTRDRVLKLDNSLLTRETHPVDDSAFDINDYLTVLPHLHLAKGYVLDYLYDSFAGNGKPKLYGRKKDAPRIHCPDLLKFIMTTSSLDQTAYTSALAALETDGTAEGFVQLALFKLLGNQFYLAWHSGYGNRPLIASYAGMNRFLADPKNFHRSIGNKQYGLPAEIQEKARAVDPSPCVEVGESSVTVSLVSFSNWGGFHRQTLEISKNPPHRILNKKTALLVKYHCGIIF